MSHWLYFFFFQAEDGIRDKLVTGVQTCALPIYVTRARAAYLAELTHRRQDDTAWYNAGTAALAGGDLETAQQALARAAASLEPDIRFRALYNLGLLALRVAGADTRNRAAHFAEAERAYREALLLNPRHLPAK